MAKESAKPVEKKTAPAKPAAVKETAAKTQTKPTVKKAAPAAKKPAAKKPAAPAKTAAAAKKTAPAAKKAAAKKPVAKKAKVVSVEEMCKKLDKMIDKTKAAKINTNVAVDVKVWGWEDECDRHFYIEIKDGVVSVAPHEYIASSFEAYISYENILKFLNGKLTLKNALATGALNANGNIPAALTIGSIF